MNCAGVCSPGESPSYEKKLPIYFLQKWCPDEHQWTSKYVQMYPAGDQIPGSLEYQKKLKSKELEHPEEPGFWVSFRTPGESFDAPGLQHDTQNPGSLDLLGIAKLNVVSTIFNTPRSPGLDTSRVHLFRLPSKFIRAPILLICSLKGCSRPFKLVIY